MSVYLKALEKVFGTALFDRNDNGGLVSPPTLTPAGVKKRLQLLEGLPFVIRIGAPAHLLTTFLPQAIRSYLRVRPDSEFRFELHVVADLKAALRLFEQADIDVVFGAAEDLPEADRPTGVRSVAAPWTLPRLLVSDDQRVLGFPGMTRDLQRALLAGKTFVTVGGAKVEQSLPHGVPTPGLKTVVADTPEVALAMIRSGVGSCAVLGVDPATVDHFRNTGELQYCTLDATVDAHGVDRQLVPHRGDRPLPRRRHRTRQGLPVGDPEPAAVRRLPAFSAARYGTPKYLYYIVSHENQNGLARPAAPAATAKPQRPRWHSEIWWPVKRFVPDGEANGIPKHTYRGVILNDAEVVYSVRATLFGQLSLSLECDKQGVAGGEARFSFSARFDGYFGDDRRGVWYGTWTGVPSDDATRPVPTDQNYNYGILMADMLLTADQIAHVSQAVTRFCIAEAFIDAEMILQAEQRKAAHADAPPRAVAAVLRRISGSPA